MYTAWVLCDGISKCTLRLLRDQSYCSQLPAAHAELWTRAAMQIQTGHQDSFAHTSGVFPSS